MKKRALTLIAAGLALGLAFPAAAGPVQPPIMKDGQYSPPKPKEGFRYPDCFCTDSVGERVELGKMACLKIGSRSFLARCDMSQNNPTWRRVSEGCPSV